jgi:RNA polymerase sporulation-specific sigma factor
MGKDNYNILTDEELVTMAQEGSATAEEFLINKYKDLVKKKSSTYFIIGGDKEDVIQEGMIGIFKAIREFNHDKNASFKTFAELCINRQIISAIRKANLQKHQILNESVSLSNEELLQDGNKPLGELITSKNDENPEDLMLMKEIVETFTMDCEEIFSPLEKKIFGKMLRGKNYREIATEIHRTNKTVDNAIQRIKKKIYGYLGY